MNSVSRTPEYEAKVLLHAALHGPFVPFKTLVGGEPDVNRRTIRNILTEEIVETFNFDMQRWTPEMEAALNRRLKVLNDDYLANMLADGPVAHE